jgi:hypothetical protein
VLIMPRKRIDIPIYSAIDDDWEIGAVVVSQGEMIVHNFLLSLTADERVLRF